MPSSLLIIAVQLQMSIHQVLHQNLKTPVKNIFDTLGKRKLKVLAENQIYIERLEIIEIRDAHIFLSYGACNYLHALFI